MSGQPFVFADAHEAYPEEQYQDIVSELLDANGFGEPDIVLLHGGPDAAEEAQRYETFTDISNELALTEDTRLLYTPGYAERIAEDYGDTVDRRPINPTSTVEEAQILAEEAQPEETILTVTGDYHVPRTDAIFDAHLDDSVNYLIGGAEWDPDETRYSEKWRSEFISTILPQTTKDIGKRALNRL